MDGLLVVDPSGAVVHSNRAFHDMWNIGERLARPGDEQGAFSKLVADALLDPAAYLEALDRLAREPGLALDEQLSLRDGREVRWTSRAILDPKGNHRGRVTCFSDITRAVCAERDAVANEARTRAIIEGARDAIVSLDDDLHVLDFNASAEYLFGWRREEVLWHAFDELSVDPGCRDRFADWLRKGSSASVATGQRAEFPLLRAGGATFPAECAVARREGNGWLPITLFTRDVSVERRLEAERGQAQKLESVGRLASGIAHEINTPLQFVGDSLHFLRGAISDLLGVLSHYRVAREGGSLAPEACGAILEAEEAADIDYLVEQLPKAMDRAADGLERVSTLVRGLKEFAHPDLKDKALADINHELATTLTIARNEYKLVADVETSFGELPKVSCVAGELNQAFLNLIVNAAHAVADVVRGTEEHGRIRVETWHDDGAVFVAIGDTGGGIPEAIRDRIFDPFFTTKEVGRGTGQGLAIARSVVVDKHGGSLTFETELGRGTTFTVRLPVKQRRAASVPS